MRAVHQEFKGRAGYVAQFGDSMTYSMAFWNPLSRSDPSIYLTDNDGLPLQPSGKSWRDVILGTDDKGPEHGNFSGWTSGQVRIAVENILAARQPEVAIILVGSNDIRSGKVPENYRANLEAIVDACLAVHCIPILNTIPPFRGKDSAVDEVNKIILETANSRKVPLADYHAACLKYRPGQSWDGTLISQDGVHPTGGKADDYSDKNLMNSGYALRNWVNFLVYRDIYFRVLSNLRL
jgi:lysophospholipase L1-like esterase